MTPRALFVVDMVNGQGHAVRSRALMAELSEQGFRCSMVGSMPKSFASCDVVIVDGVTVDWNTPSYSCAFVAIVDEPHQIPHAVPHVDLMVCGSAGVTPSLFADGQEILAGPQYALLRPAFRESRNQKRTDNVPVQDLRNVQGADAKAMASFMMNCGVAITYSGMRAMEAACVGTPMVLIARNEGEKLNQSGLSDFLPQHDGKNTPAGVCCFDEILATYTAAECDDPLFLSEMSEAGKVLVDGLGCSRVASEIKELVG